jgi:UPF0755 protein
MAEAKKRSLSFLKFVIYLLILAAVSGAALTYLVWHRSFMPNVTTGHEETVDFYLPSGTDMGGVLDLLEQKNLIIDRSTLEWLAKKKNYHNNVRPGRYRLRDGMSNNQLINMLRSGNQVPVNLIFINQRTIEDIASVVSRQIEADSSDISRLARNKEFIESIGFCPASLPALFIPNTYQIYWNTTAEQFFMRMKSEYDRFWNKTRENKLHSINLDRAEVSTLASIIIEETVKYDEMPVIAGVYINRLKRGIPLQADPTIKFAMGDFTVNRILRVHLQIDSPYNTYRHAGLPPGPIVIPPAEAIDAVLNAEKHDYLYFCAREDFSGYHRFAKTLSEHNRNARLYQNALNQRRIFR